MKNISTLQQILLIIGLSIILGVFRNIMLDDTLTWKKENRKLDVISDFIIPRFMVEPLAIDIEFAHYLHTKNQAVFIDARDIDDYETGHISDAINIPFDDIDNYESVIIGLDPDFPVVIYCSGGECDLSVDLGDLLFDEYDFSNVLIFEGGYPNWKELGYLIE